MFDIGWQEIFVISAVVIVVVGPKDLPRVLAQVTKYVRKARGIAREFQGSIDEVVRQVELDDIRKEVEKASNFDLENEIRNTVDPTGEITRDLDLSGAQSELERTAAAVNAEPGEPMGPPVAAELPAATAEPVPPAESSPDAVDDNHAKPVSG